MLRTEIIACKYPFYSHQVVVLTPTDSAATMKNTIQEWNSRSIWLVRYVGTTVSSCVSKYLVERRVAK